MVDSILVEEEQHYCKMVDHNLNFKQAGIDILKMEKVEHSLGNLVVK